MIGASGLSRLEAWLRHHRCGPEVAARIRRLNPRGLQEGDYPRGWHPSETWRSLSWSRGLAPIGKREFIARYGREAWRRLEPFDLCKIGRRRRMTREAWLDNRWVEGEK